MTSTGAFGTSPPGTPRTPGAFPPVAPGRRRTGRRRTPLPGLYGAGDLDGALIDGALSETVCHDVPIRGASSWRTPSWCTGSVSPWWPAAISSWISSGSS
jgi:hypothetical protein